MKAILIILGILMLYEMSKDLLKSTQHPKMYSLLLIIMISYNWIEYFYWIWAPIVCFIYMVLDDKQRKE
jgi:hypothetical protein